MTEICLINSGGYLLPCRESDKASLSRHKVGEVMRVKISKMRNGRFFRKWWVLVDFAYAHWEPGEILDLKYEGLRPEKNKERFRKDLTILAGHYRASYRVDGSVRVEAESIAWANMTEDEFEKFYSATIDAVLKHILTRGYTRSDLDDVVERLLLGFA